MERSKVQRTFCPYCGKPIEWCETAAGRMIAVDPQIMMFRKLKEGEKGITLLTPLGDIMEGITTRNMMYAWDYGNRVHKCYMTGRLRR